MSNISGNSLTATTGADILMMPIPTFAMVVPNPAGMECMLPASSGSDPIDPNKILHAPVLNNDSFSNSGNNLTTVPGPLGNILQCQHGVGGISMGTGNQVMPTIGEHDVRSRMIPTPGFGESQFVGTKKASSGGMGYGNVNYVEIASPQQFTGGKNGQIYYEMSEQICGTMGGIKMQLKNSSCGFINFGVQQAGNNQHLVNGTTALSNSGYLNASEYNNLQASSQQNDSQQGRQNLMQSAIANESDPLAGDNYAMNAADLLGSGNLYGRASSGRLGAFSHRNSRQQCPQNIMQSAIANELAPLAGDDYALNAADLLGSKNCPALSGGLLAATNLNRDSLGSAPTKLKHVQGLQTQQHQQMQRSQQQQQLPVEGRSILLNQPTLTDLGQKRGGTETHLGGASKKELSEQSSVFLPLREQQQFTLYNPLVRQSGVLNDNSLSKQSVSPFKSGKFEKQQVLSSEEQQQTQSGNVYNNLSAHVKPEVSLQELQSQKKIQLPQQLSNLIQKPQPPQQEPSQVLEHYITLQHQPSQQSLGNNVASTAMSQERCGTAGYTTGDAHARTIAKNQKMQLVRRQLWLIYFDHSRKCSDPECECRSDKYIASHKLWAHVTTCNDRGCTYKNCLASQKLIEHHKCCCDKDCSVCVPVREHIMQQCDNKHAHSSIPGTAEFLTAMPNSSNFKTTVGTNINLQPKSMTEKQKMELFIEQQLLIYFDHARKCSDPECKCRTDECITRHKLWAHITTCNDRECSYKNCCASKKLRRHHQYCRDKECLVCGPVRKRIMQQRDSKHPQSSIPGTAEFVTAMPNSLNFKTAVGTNINFLESCVSPVLDAIQDGQPPVKRRKIKYASPSGAQQEVRSTLEFVRLTSETEGLTDEQPPIKPRNIEPASPSCSHQKIESMPICVKSPSEMQGVSQMQIQNFHQNGHDLGIIKCDALETIKLEPAPVMIEQAMSLQQEHFQKFDESNKDTLQNPCDKYGKMQGQLVKAELAMSLSGIVPKEDEQEPMQAMQETIMDVPSDHSASENFGKSMKRKAQAVSLMELFTLGQIGEHITGLRQWVGQIKANAENHQAMKCQMNEYTCSLCEVGELTFDPPPIYCSRCWSRIKQNATAYFVDAGDTRHCICISCFKKFQSDIVEIDGNAYPKSKFVKEKIEEVGAEEVCVQCDNCKRWQHNICALFNGKRNEEEPTEYTCPNCYTEQIKRGVRKPLPQSAVLGAKDLPTTCLSDHIEQRLCRRLKDERQERAKHLGKSFEEVPGAEELVVRVVSSVNKILEVKQRFPEFLQLEDFPTKLPYKSKVLLLFQTIEGVEICLFCMFVQEYGSDCAHPNQRRIYLSYLDSVKYFRPDVKAVTSEALRTFVFHEILIGYLEYSKRRGFTSCYIWSSPPSKGDDYILNCHPEIQKTPQPFKLREWYLTMLRKASKEKIVVYETNMYDYFFVSTGERKAKVTAARLPFFDGDYFSDEAVKVIMPQLEQEEQDQHKHQKTKKSTTKRSSRAAAQAEFASSSSKDLLLMKKLGDCIHHSKKDFIMVHLQHACTHCCFFIVSGKRWVCKQCKNFQLCDKCYELEQKLNERDSHPKNNREKHVLFPIEVTDVPADTKDNDDIIKCEFFDTRHTFLSLCRGNHYQFDTMRRAKHSSMMVLYHLHNPSLPAIMRTCSKCRHDIKKGQGWRSEISVDFDLCNDCYSLRLMALPSLDDRNTKNQESHERLIREEQKIKMLDSVKHSCKCVSQQCTYQNCQNLRRLFRHGMNCKTGEGQGCTPCKKMWYLLQLHARTCKESDCCVYRCKDLKQQMGSQNQMESQRTADTMETMRQQSAKIA